MQGGTHLQALQLQLIVWKVILLSISSSSGKGGEVRWGGAARSIPPHIRQHPEVGSVDEPLRLDVRA